MSKSASPSGTKSEPGKPERNPLERLIVWGGITLAVILIFTEGQARFGYSMSLNRLQARIHDDESSDPDPLTATESADLIVGFPSKTVKNQVVTYRFRGLVKEFGAIHLAFDDEDHVLGLKTDAPPEPPAPKAAPDPEEGEAIAPAASFGQPATPVNDAASTPDQDNDSAAAEPQSAETNAETSPPE